MGDGWRGVGLQVADGWRGVGLQMGNGWRGVGLQVADGWRGAGLQVCGKLHLSSDYPHIHYTHTHIQTYPVILRYCGEAGPPALPDRPEELPVGLQVCQPVRGGPQPPDC